MKLKNENFKLIKKEKNKNIQAEFYEFEYLPLKTKIIWLKNKDQNRAFSVGFRTPPTNDKGINHILEHSVLRGSRKYPFVKEEVFALLAQKSIYTFLNAMTYPDRTVYPFSSNHKKEFLKILDVYLDSVYFPKVLEDEKIFKQEGWRYDLDENGKIIFNGVVFNEMKGRYSDPDRNLWELQTKELFPDTVYKFESGGNPKEIIKLKYKELKEYHQNYYHPSNSVLYFYGDLKIEKIFDYLEKDFFQFFKKKNIKSKIKIQKKIKERIEKEVEYFSENKNDNILSFSFVLGKSWEVKKNLEVKILNNILLSGDNAKLKRRILDLGLVGKIESHIETSLNQVLWEINLKGVKKKDLEILKNKFWAFLDEIIKEGINKKEIEVEYKKIEINLKKENLKTNNGLSYGLNLMKLWNYREYLNKENFDFNDYFKYSEILKEVKKDIFEEEFFEKLLKKNLIKNNHSLVLKLLTNSKIDQEKELKKIERDLNKKKKDEKKKIIQEIDEFKKWQQQEEPKENLNLIKSLKKDDLPDSIKDREYLFDIEKKKYIFQKTQGSLNILSLGFDVNFLSERELQVISLYLKLLNKGKFETETRDTQEVLLFIKQFFGNFDFYLFFIKDKKEEILRKIVLNLIILSKDRKKVFGFLNEIFNSEKIKIQKKDLKNLIEEEKINFKNSLAYSGREVAIYKNLSGKELHFYLKNKISGLDYYEFLKNIDIDEVFEEIEDLKKEIWNKNNLLISESGKKKDINIFNELKFKSQKKQNKELNNEYLFDFEKINFNDGYIFSSLRNSFNTLILELENLKDEKVKPEHIVTIISLLNFDYLWKKIREEGGAYGGGVKFYDDKYLVFASYMDSRIDGTYEDFLNFNGFLKNLTFDENLINSLIVKTNAEFLKPKSELNFAFNNLIDVMSKKYDRDKKYKNILKLKEKDIRKIIDLFDKILSINENGIINDNLSKLTLANREKLIDSNLILNEIK